MNRLCTALVTAATLCLAQQATRAGGGPENVFLIVNPNSADSLEIANEYVAMRGIPTGNVFYLPWAPQAWRTMGADFRDKMLKPILQEIDKRKLAGQIDNLVYSSNFPWQIDFRDLHVAKEGRSPDIPVASLTGASYLYQFVLSNDRRIAALNNNFYFAQATAGVTKSQAFHGRVGWSPAAKPDDKGIHYLMSTVLGVTTGAGTTVDETVHYLRRAANADGTRPQGGFYYMVNGKNPRSTARHDGFAAAVAELEALGQNAVIVNGIVPKGQRAVLGITCGAPQAPLAGSNSTLQPGALVDNLTSAGGQLTARKNGTGQTPLTDYLKYGAAGASGTVVEPFAIRQKFPSPDLHVHYARGCCLSESFYQAVQGPYQLLIAGDPLCQPWAVPGEVSLTLPGLGGMIDGVITLAPQVAYPDLRAVGHLELFVDGVRVAAGRGLAPLTLDTTKLPDGPHQLTVVAVDNTPIEVQSRWSQEVIVKNGSDALQVTAAGGPRITGDEAVLAVAGTRDAETIVTHNGRELGRVTGREGQLRIKTSLLGPGPVQIEARIEGDEPLVSRPLHLQIARER
ncbi:MAG: TIGR03790 family protein [Planctomycetales bacterium]|nr:TIGR03790 family protein [Planctomycetales bacterium]